MPPVLSKESWVAKILGHEWSFGYNCYEVGHTWTPSCTDAALEVSLAAALKVAPLYVMLYTFSQVAVQQRFDWPATWETSKSIVRSSSFIFFHAYNGSVMGCALRRGFGRFYYRVLVCAPALLSSYLSIAIETPARRKALAFYMLNLASEILYRMMVTKGLFRPVERGETLLFAASLAAWYYLARVHGFGHDPVSGAVKVLVGRYEATSRAKRIEPMQNLNQFEGRLGPQERQNNASLVASRANGSLAETSLANGTLQQRARSKLSILSIAKYYSKCLDFLGRQLVKPDGIHATCPHSHHYATCLNYALGPIPSRFLIGYLIQSGLRLASRPFDLIRSPAESIKASLMSASSFRFGLFLVSLVSAGRATSCLLRHHTNTNDCHWHAAVSGFVAGLSMLWSPKSSISMYVMWKAVEQYYLLAASRKGTTMNEWQGFTISTIYACSAATILYTFALEPRFIRPSYMKFIDNLSNHRLHQLNRMVLDIFGTGSSVGYEDFFPDLDPKYMSNQFKELVFNWMIQPYE